MCTRSDLYLGRNLLLFGNLKTEIDRIVTRRKLHEPLAYILGKIYFHSKEFNVDKNVLIPRPETEILVETILINEKNTRCFFLDMGIGSGAIGAILAQKNEQWRGIGIDLSLNSLRVATTNCPPGTISLLNADFFSSIKPLGVFDFIVCNPPYISSGEMEQLDKSVKDFEPPMALLGGDDGLHFYRLLAKQAGIYLKPDGRLYCEIGSSQADAVRAILASNQWDNIMEIQDLAGLPRIIHCKRPRTV
jgi:release factor glutamine methyltransferase